MKYRYAFIFFYIAFLLQATVMIHINIVRVSPNLILCLVLSLAFMYEGYQGLVFGIIFGLLQDLSFSVIIGPTAVSYFVVSLLMNELKRFLYRDSILNIFFASIIGTIVHYTLNWGIVSVFGGIYDFIFVLKGLPVLLIYHIVITTAFYLIVGRRTIRHPQDRYYKGNKLYLG